MVVGTPVGTGIAGVARGLPTGVGEGLSGSAVGVGGRGSGDSPTSLAPLRGGEEAATGVTEGLGTRGVEVGVTAAVVGAGDW